MPFGAHLAHIQAEDFRNVQQMHFWQKESRSQCVHKLPFNSGNAMVKTMYVPL